MTRAKGTTPQDPTVDRFVAPNGQTVRGTGAANLPNPKNSQARRPEVRAVTPNADDLLTQTSKVGTTTNFPGSSDPSMARPGTNSTVPDPAILNRGYTEIENVGPSSLTNVSANRQKFGIDPGADSLDPQGVSVDKGPNVPKFGVGTVGE